MKNLLFICYFAVTSLSQHNVQKVQAQVVNDNAAFVDEINAATSNTPRSGAASYDSNCQNPTNCNDPSSSCCSGFKCRATSGRCLRVMRGRRRRKNNNNSLAERVKKRRSRIREKPRSIPREKVEILDGGSEGGEGENTVEETPPATTPTSSTSTPAPSLTVKQAVTPKPTPRPTPKPTPKPKPILYRPGDYSAGLKSNDGRVKLSNGLRAKLIAWSGGRVRRKDGSQSALPFHSWPDGGAVFPAASGGGWIYVSNCEDDRGEGGVGAIDFDRNGNVLNYRRILRGTQNNCGGGKTPWNSWITCEEIFSGNGGQVWQTDPYGRQQGQVTALGRGGGSFESFAYDVRPTLARPRFFVTHDSAFGELRRFEPDNNAMRCYNKQDPSKSQWCTLNSGTLSYLVLEGGSSGRFGWSPNIRDGQETANRYFPNAEGIDVRDGILYFTSKAKKRLFILNLDQGTWRYHSTVSGAFNNQPDQVARVLGDKANFLYFCEDGGRDNGVHGRDGRGRFFSVADSLSMTSETTGLAFSPDGKHMYVVWQQEGLLYDITRMDGMSFGAKTLDIKYHQY